MNIPNIDDIKMEEQARDTALDWQTSCQEEQYSYGELSDWQDFFTELTHKFPALKDEFKENAII